jgi:alkanesulfonate monooxygenase SsuD/methylene tetrahydromethanopterin reductase-like flavin-dependent oxidoreductase (luciferase family)
MLHAMDFDQIVANDMVILGSPKTVADTILRIAGQLELMGLAMIFKLGTMPYDTVERSMRLLGEEVVPRIRHILDRDAHGDPVIGSPAIAAG